MRRALAMLAIGLAGAASFVGCAFDWGFPADSSSGGEDGGGGTTESSVTDALLEVSTPPIDGDSGDGGPVVKSCFQANDCASMKEYCQFSDDRCGKGSTTGVCVPTSTACSAKDDEVCACDGKTYPSECTANGLGLDLAKSGCPIDAGTQFACGTHVCDQNKEYCLVGSSSPPTYDCKVPAMSSGACTSPLSCGCSSIIALGCTCSGSPGAITLSGTGCKG